MKAERVSITDTKTQF